jgi:hypothetical protein
MTKAQLLSDVQLQLLQSSPSDDSQLEWDQIAFWATYELNSLVAAECNTAIKSGKQIPAVYKKVANLEVAEVEDSHEQDRIYVELDEDILTLSDEGGIVLVETEDGDEIPRTSVERFASLKKLRFAKPTINRPLYYTRGSKIFLLGFNETDIPFEKIHVHYIPKQDLLTAVDTYEVLVSSSITPMLIDAIVQRGKLELYGTQIDSTNDGVQNITPVYHKQIENPNAESFQQP